VTAVAAVQHGVVSRDQLRAAGVSDGAVTGMVARGELVRVYRGVYRLSPVVHVPLAREVAALLACGPEAVLSHRTAADLWALPVALSRGLHVVRRTHGPEPVGVTVHRSRTLTAQDIRHRHGLPLTSPARTLLDLAETLTPRQLERAVDEALVKHIVRPSAPLAGFNVDFLWRTERLAVEVDSWDYHRTRATFEHDRRRGNAIQAAGYQLLRPTTDQLENEPTALVATVAGLLARAA
jgi:very-short-patch-repair endonuclease